MHSESLAFVFQNTFGYDTLMVNGCFEEGRKNGFVTASKTLALENLNNLGISFSFGVFFNVPLMNLIFSRLIGIQAKLKAKPSAT